MNRYKLLATLLFVCFAHRDAQAQCATPDGLDGGPGCTGATTVVQHSKFAQQALGICWQNCGLNAVMNYRAQWGTLMPMALPPAIPASCGWYTSALTLYLGATPVWQGSMHLTYARTWTENAGPVRFQVWRFLVNGDLRHLTTSAGPCAIPPCAAPNGNRTRFTGYVDYAMRCAPPTVSFQHAWMITHGCDAIDHVAGHPRAGVYHPNRFYTFVGPRAGFLPLSGSTVESGTMATECLRRWDVPVLPARCNKEEPLLFATFTPTTTTCVCGVGPALWHQASFSAAGNAGSVVSPYPGSDPFRSFPIGRWTNPAIYPGVEEVRWNTNDLAYTDCTGATRNEYYYGVTTAGGHPAFTLPSISPPPSAPLPMTFVDQSNSALLPGGVALRNVPYRSDHVLNLNL